MRLPSKKTTSILLELPGDADVKLYELARDRRTSKRDLAATILIAGIKSEHDKDYGQRTVKR